MFGIGSGELFFIAIVALIVLGPERLPKAARFVGLWVRRARAHWYSVKDELERELAAEELKRNLDSARASVREMETSLREQGTAVQREFERVRDEVASGVETAVGDTTAVEPPVAADPDAPPALLDGPPPESKPELQPELQPQPQPELQPDESALQTELPLDAPRPAAAEKSDARRD